MEQYWDNVRWQGVLPRPDSIRPLNRQARDSATGPACVSNNSFQESSSAWLLVRRFFDTRTRLAFSTRHHQPDKCL